MCDIIMASIKKFCFCFVFQLCMCSILVLFIFLIDFVVAQFSEKLLYLENYNV